jgi:ribosome maturation factor RimP
MISKERIHELLDIILTEKQAFLVDYSVSKGNKIKILIDKLDGLSIQDCVEVSRFVEHRLNRDEEDFDLEVSSPGASEPLKIREQYIKNTGRVVDVITNDDAKHKGKLLEVKDDNIVLEETMKVKKEGSKKKKTVTKIISISFNEIQKTNVVISFK